MTEFAGQKILVVEDVYYLAMDVKKAIEEGGAEVVGPFPDVRSALESLKFEEPDCAVLDVNLGSGASFELARALNNRGIPFVFFTGYDQSAIPAEFAQVTRLEKPVSGDRLVKLLASYCQPRTAPSGAARSS